MSYKCSVSFTVNDISHVFTTETESHPEDISDEIWTAMIQNDQNINDPIRIIDISWLEPSEILIDVEDIAKEMKNRGVTSIEDGWTNTLMDILEELYQVETLTRIKMFGE